MMMSGLKSWISCTCFRSVRRHRDHGAAQALGAVVGAQAAGEQAVAVGDMHQVARVCRRGTDRAATRLAQWSMSFRCSRRRSVCRWCRKTRGRAHHAFARHGEHAEG